MSLVCSWNEVGMKLVMSYVKFPQAPFARAPLGECRTVIAEMITEMLRFEPETCICNGN